MRHKIGIELTERSKLTRRDVLKRSYSYSTVEPSSQSFTINVGNNELLIFDRDCYVTIVAEDVGLSIIADDGKRANLVCKGLHVQKIVGHSRLDISNRLTVPQRVSVTNS